MTDFGFYSIENVLEVTAPIPKVFSFKKEDWPQWIAHFEQYRKASKLDTSDEKVQINALLSHMGPNAPLFLDEMNRSEESFVTYDEFVKSIEEHFQKRVNVILERARFNTRQQRENESAEQFIAAVARMAKNCDYGDMEAELIRDRLVVGIRDRKCSEALQLEEHLTLEKAKSIIVQAENIKKTKNLNIHKSSEQRKKGEDTVCGRCGAAPIAKGHHAACPAPEAKCSKCGHKGHYAKCCATNPKRSRTSSLHNKEESFEFL